MAFAAALVVAAAVVVVCAAAGLWALPALLDAERGHTVEWETENPLT